MRLMVILLFALAVRSSMKRRRETVRCMKEQSESLTCCCDAYSVVTGIHRTLCLFISFSFSDDGSQDRFEFLGEGKLYTVAVTCRVMSGLVALVTVMFVPLSRSCNCRQLGDGPCSQPAR